MGRENGVGPSPIFPPTFSSKNGGILGQIFCSHQLPFLCHAFLAPLFPSLFFFFFFFFFSFTSPSSYQLLLFLFLLACYLLCFLFVIGNILSSCLCLLYTKPHQAKNQNRYMEFCRLNEICCSQLWKYYLDLRFANR